MAEFTVPVIGVGLDASVMYVRRTGEGVDGNGDAFKNNRDYVGIPINLKWKINVPVVSHISTTSVPCADGQRELRTSFPSLFSRHLLHRSVNNFLFHLHSIAFLFCKKVTGVLPIHQSNFPISLFLPGKVHPPNQVVSDGVCNYCRIPTFYKIC